MAQQSISCDCQYEMSASIIVMMIWTTLVQSWQDNIAGHDLKFLCFIEETVRGMCDYHDTKSDNNWDIITAQLRFISLFTQQLIFTNQNISLK